MQTDKDIPGISCGLVDDNIFEWTVMLMINDDCKYYGGMSSSTTLIRLMGHVNAVQVVSSAPGYHSLENILSCPRR